MTTGLGQNCVTRGRGPLEIPFCKPQIGAKTETWLENSWRRSDNIVGDLEENYGIWIHGDGTAYSDYHAPGGFLAHHLARISMAAVYWDAQHIDEGVRFLKQHARPHA